MNAHKVQSFSRFMIMRDLYRVLEIENQVFDYPWTQEDFLHCLGKRNAVGMVAEVDGQIAAYMVYEFAATRIHLLNFAVAPEFQRLGVGSQLIEKLKAKVGFDRRRTSIVFEVRETNLDGQLFLKSHGFRAVCVLRDHWETAEDAYLMKYRPR